VRGRNYGQTIRTDRWRYIQWSDGTAELYDQLNDVEDTHDVAGDPANGKLIEELKMKLKTVGSFEPDSNAVPKAKKNSKRAEIDADTFRLAGLEANDK
jgi:iduronate 2-sulfatase